MKRSHAVLPGFLLAFVLTAVGQTEAMGVPPDGIDGKPVPRGDRIISVDVNMGKNQDFNVGFNLARDAGMQNIGLFQHWTVLEPDSGKYDSKWLDIAEIYYPTAGVKLDLTLALYNANKKEYPRDLVDCALDDPLVVERFEKLLDFVFSRFKKMELGSINIGSEFNIYFGDDGKSWEQFRNFYARVARYARRKRPGLKVAAEVTFDGLTGATRGYIRRLNEESDLIGVSYYPLDGKGNVKDPAVVREDFNTIVSMCKDKPVYIYQLGYPSSQELGSSVARQAEFIREVFRAWDLHVTAIRMIDFTWLYDTSESSAGETGKYYGMSGKKFAEFIRTLGLLTYTGGQKPAFRALKEEAGARGWRTR
jgi:hypothetical protein